MLLCDDFCPVICAFNDLCDQWSLCPLWPIQGPPRAGVWRNRFVRTDTYTQMCTIYYVPAACREQCTIDPSPIRVISKFRKKTCWPLKASWDTRNCAINRRIRAIHNPPLPFQVPTMPNFPFQYPIHVFQTCPHHLPSFPQPIWGSTVPQPMTRPTIMWRAFSQNRLYTDPIMAHSVHYMHWWHIRMLRITISWLVAGDISISKVPTRQASTGVRRTCQGCRSHSFIFSHCFVLKS